MPPRSREQGYLLMDVIVGLALFGFLVLAIYRLYLPTFALSRQVNDQLAVQQDVRLAVDRVARVLHETAAARVAVYPAAKGCTGTYDACIAFVTARDAHCTGDFQLVNGAPNWQAMVYLWRDTGSNELRLWCDPTTTFPAPMWPVTGAPSTVVGSNVVAASFALQPADSAIPTSIVIALQERTPRASWAARSLPTQSVNRTVFVPQNR